MMKKVRALARPSGVLVLAVLSSAQASLERVQSGKGLRAVEVVVEDLKSHHRIPRARVFVLSEEGKLLAEAWTDASGSARLPDLATEAKPKYLLVECDWFFVVGRRWLPGQMEYLMPLLPLTPPGMG
jgi:hypothetical protein